MTDTVVRPVSPANSDGGFPAALRGFGPVGIFAIVAIFLANFAAPLSAVLVIAWAFASRTPLADIGLVRPRSWLGGLVFGTVFGVAFKVLMKAVVMPLLGAPPVNEAYHYLAGNPALVPQMLFSFIIAAGFGEEVLFRGFLFERLGSLIGKGAPMKAVIVLLGAVLFGLAHYSVQGLPGMEQAMITGFVFGSWFAITGSLYTIMVAHAAFDLAAYAMIYWNLETYFAHLIYR
jgi:membrane protease YdiL (CAAX protease family)